MPPAFQIPATQACIMEDIEQWLSTDVVSGLTPYLPGRDRIFLMDNEWPQGQGRVVQSPERSRVNSC